GRGDAGGVLRDAVAAQERRSLPGRKDRLHRGSDAAAVPAAAPVIDRLRARALHALEEIARVPWAGLQVEVAEHGASKVGQAAAEGVDESLAVRLVVGDHRGALDVELAIRTCGGRGSLDFVGRGE